MDTQGKTTKNKRTALYALHKLSRLVVSFNLTSPQTEPNGTLFDVQCMLITQRPLDILMASGLSLNPAVIAFLLSIRNHTSNSPLMNSTQPSKGTTAD